MNTGAVSNGEPSRRSKWRWVVGFWAGQTVVMWLGLGPLAAEGGFSARDFGHPEYIMIVLGWGLAVAAAQAVFLWPVRRPAAQLGRGVSVWLTMGAAGLAAAALAGGLLLAAVDGLWLLTGQEPNQAHFWTIVAFMILAWLVATPLLAAFCRQRSRESALGRVSAWLFLGTMVETVAIVPLDVMVRRKTDCYCGQGTFWALVLCGSVGLFALGPAIYLPMLGRRRKRWYAGHCDACGYDMTGTPGAERCPECGAGWRAGGVG